MIETENTKEIITSHVATTRATSWKELLNICAIDRKLLITA